jgi:antirestriction protein
MSVSESFTKLKAPEIKLLAKDIGLKLMGREKKSDLLGMINAALDAKLNSMTLDDLKYFADSIGLDIPAAIQPADCAALLKPALTDAAVRQLFNVSSQQQSQLEEIGGELKNLEKDMESVLDKLEHLPPPDMTDIYVIDQKLTDVVKTNIDYSNVASLLDVGRIKFLDRKYVESMTILDEAIKASEDMIQKYCDITQAFIILSAEKVLEECRDSKSNNEKAADMLIHAKRTFSSRGANRLEAIQALSELAKKVHREEVIILEQRLAQVEPLINAMRVQGVDIFNAERYIHRARESFLIGDLASVTAYLDKSVNMANESKNQWINEIRNDIPRVESIIHQASELGADTAEAEKHLLQAKSAFANKDYSLCSELKKQAERKAMESQHSQIQKAAKLEREKLGDAEKILSSLVPIMREAEAYGINVMEMSGSMHSARNALMNNDYVNALTYARDAESRSKSVLTQVKSFREHVIASREPLQLCQTCNVVGVKLFPQGKAVCVNCGMVYDVQVREPEQKKSSWFKKK